MGRHAFVERPAAAHMASTARASAVVRGLLRTGRACPRLLSETGDQVAEFARLERRGVHGECYCVSRDGSEVRAGINFTDAEAPQPGFLYAMERAGAMPQKS